MLVTIMTQFRTTSKRPMQSVEHQWIHFDHMHF